MLDEDPYRIGNKPPCTHTDPLQSLSAGDLTPEHIGRRISAGTAKAAVLDSVEHTRHGYTTVWLIVNGGGVLPLTLSDTAPVQLDAPQEVTGD